MKFAMPLWLGWMHVLAAAAGAGDAGPAQPATIRVFADLHHTGILSGPLPFSPAAANEFGIAAPLPASWADRDALPAKIPGGEEIFERLGRLRVETNLRAGAVVISISSENGRCLRLFHNVDHVWRLAAPKTGQSWTLTPDIKGILELAIGVVLPAAKSGASDPVWPRTFAVEIGPAAPSGNRIRVPFRVAPYLIPSTLDPVEELF